MSDSLWPHGLQHARLPCPFSISWSLLKLMSTESVMPSNHLVLCHPLLLLPSIFPSIRIFSNELALHIRKIGMALNISLACWYFCVCVCACVCVCLHPNDADMSYVNPKIFNKFHSQFSTIWGKVAKMWKQQSHESPEEHETAVLFLTSKWPANLLELSSLHRGL